MKAKIAGVALAAVMACGWAGSAQAAIYEFGVSTNEDHGYYDAVSGYINTDTMQLDYREDYVVCLNYDCYNQPIRTTKSRVVQDANFTLSTTQTNFGYDHYLIGPELQVYYESVTPDPFTVANLFNYKTPYIDYNGGLAFYQVDALGSVPLPASAPLFGAALLALAGVGCARRGKVVAA